ACSFNFISPLAALLREPVRDAIAVLRDRRSDAADPRHLSLTARLLCAALLCARHGFRAAAHIDARTIAPRHLGIDEAGNQDAAVECYDLTIARTASGLLAGADVVLAIRCTLEAEFGRLGLVGEMHDDAAAGTAAD